MSYEPSSGWLEDAICAATGKCPPPDKCFIAADAKTAPMFAKRQQVSASWNPTGTYTPGDLELVVNHAFEMMRDAGVTVLDKALDDDQLPGARSALMSARDAIFRQEAKQFAYRDAIRNARATGVKQIVAPDLKRWVIGAMEVTQAAVFAASMVACERPWWLNAAAKALRVFAQMADAIMAVAGAVLDVASSAIKVASEIGTIVKIAVAGAAAYAGWMAWKRYSKR